MYMSYSEETVQAIWEKARIVEDNDAAMWRKDECGAWIQRMMYGDRTSQYGWEIDLISNDDPDRISTMCPLHWRNRIRRSDGRLVCAVTAGGIDNKELTGGQTVVDHVRG
jgi:hypothetical protein